MDTTNTRVRQLRRFLAWSWLCFSLLSFSQAQTVTPWLTTGNQSQLINQQSSVSFGNSSSNAFADINLDATQSFQSIEGLGFMLTQGSAEVISGLSSSQRNTLLNELFDPNTGLGISMLRISIGASDLSNSTYTYNETAGDVNMNNFSLAGPDQTYLIPILQQILSMNPNIKILATPWTAPTWMKTNGSFTGGSLSSCYYPAYATYFVRYLQEMNANNIPIWGITPQNEPENPFNTPSMVMTANEQIAFINNHLGPAIANSGFSPKIIAFDHNCDNPNYPITVLNNSSYTDGAAFHLYGGDISAMSQVHNATGKDVYFTEQYTDVNGNFSGDLSWHMRNVVIGSLNNFARTVLEWNLATDENYGPRTQGGCTECLGALTISSNGSMTRNVSYYIIGQLARFANAGATRFQASSNNNLIHATALQNPDQSKVLLVYNDRSQSTTVKVIEGGQAFTYSIPGKSAATFTWSGGGNGGGNNGGGFSPMPGDYNILARHSGKGLDVAGSSLSSGANVVQNTISNGGGANQRWRFEDAGAGNFHIKVRHSDMCLAAANNQQADGINVVQRNCNGAANQTWTVTDLGNGYHSITNLHNGRVLDVAGVSTANGANVQVWSNFSSDNQQWELVQVSNSNPPPPSQAYYNILARHSGKGLDVAGASTSSGANVEQYAISNGGGDNQRWRFEDAGNGNVYIKAKHSDMCLAAASNQQADGVNVVQNSCNGADNQTWTVTDLGNGYHSITNLHNGRVLDVASASTANNANVQLWTNFSSDNQQWELVQVEGGNTRLRNSQTDHLMETVELDLFPNPTRDRMVIRLSHASTIQKMELIDPWGKSIQVPRVRQTVDEITISLTALSPGIYFLRVSLPNQQLVRRIQRL
ncbi:MAG: RICIN domain-containing protein [Bacteroidota bacterium]